MTVCNLTPSRIGIMRSRLVKSKVASAAFSWAGMSLGRSGWALEADASKPNAIAMTHARFFKVNALCQQNRLRLARRCARLPNMTFLFQATAQQQQPFQQGRLGRGMLKH